MAAIGSRKWELLTVAEAVLGQLPADVTSQCCVATRLLIAVCGYAIEHGQLMCDDYILTRMKGTVLGKKLAMQDMPRGHWWMRAFSSQDVNAHHQDIDLTAKQFYRRLPTIYRGNPEEEPLKVSLTGRDKLTGDACGEEDMATAEFKDKSVVLREFAKYSGDWETKLRRIYRELGM